MQAGDFILTHDNSFYAKLIQFGQSRRFGKQYAYWTHAAILTSDTGDLIEAVSKGVRTGHISNYSEYRIFDAKASAEDRAEAVAFAKSCLNEGYGWLNIISTSLAFLTGLKFSFGLSSEKICSGLVARSLERTSAIFPFDTNNIPPAVLAQMYETVDNT